jgi:hypothetical protein
MISGPDTYPRAFCRAKFKQFHAAPDPAILSFKVIISCALSEDLTGQFLKVQCHEIVDEIRP